MGDRLAKRVVVLGWDAADWKLIDPLMAAGKMPHLAAFLKDGVRGEMTSLDPKLSPLLWTSVATGKTADRHGILHFIEPDPASGGMRISMATSRKTKALWNILTQAGLKTNVLSWYASHPAEPINGCIISNMVQEGMPGSVEAKWDVPAGAVHPTSMTERIAELRLHPGELRAEEMLGLLPRLAEMNQNDPRIGLAAKLLANCASVHNMATAMLAGGTEHGLGEAAGWDCAMLFYDAIDVFGHHFMQYHPPRMGHVSEKDFELYRNVMNAVYEFHDAMLGVILQITGAETTVVLLSDHGFHSDHLRPPVPPALDDAHAAMDATWHRPLGIIAMRGPGIRKGETLYGANLLDIAPTVLTLLGQPVGADMNGRVLVEALDPPVNIAEIEKVFSWDDLEGEAGMHPPDMRTDPFESQQAMKQLADLGYIAALSGDMTAQLATLERETQFNLGVIFMTTRRIPQAIAVFEKLHGAHPRDDRFALNLAQCYHERGRYEDAARILNEFIALCPNHPAARTHLAVALVQQNKLDEARAALAEAQKHTPDNPDLLYLLGWVQQASKEMAAARKTIERALQIDPHHPKAHHALALIAVQEQKFDEAVDHALRTVEIQHFFPDAHYTLGVALTWTKDYDNAIRCFQIALSMQPGLVDAHRYLASIYRMRGDFENAPIHRRAAEALLEKRKAGGAHLADFLSEPPMGPEQWERERGEIS